MACEKHFQDREQDSGGRHAVLQRDVARHAERVLMQRRGPADDGDGVRRAGSITGARHAAQRQAAHGAPLDTYVSVYADLPDTWNQILYTQLLKSIGSLGVDQWGNMSPDSLLIATELTFLSYDIPRSPC
jgi:hypothetical protein